MQLEALPGHPAPGDRLKAADEGLSRAFAELDAAIGALQEPEHGAALRLREEVADVKRRLGALRTFVGSAAVDGGR